MPANKDAYRRRHLRLVIDNKFVTGRRDYTVTADAAFRRWSDKAKAARRVLLATASSPFSQRETVDWRTPSNAPNSLCVSSRSCLIRAISFIDREYMRIRIIDASQICALGIAGSADSLQTAVMLKIGRRIATMRKAKGLKQEAFADELGVTQSTVSRWESGKQEPEYTHLRAIAQWAGTGLDAFTEGTDASTSPLHGIQVVGHVQAGEWQHAAEWDEDDRYTIGVPHDERYPQARQFGLVVRGRSMDQIYPEGSIIICASLYDLDREPEDGERVIVYRKSADDTIEATVKQFQRDPDGRCWLWPRSSRPEHQQPVELGGAESVEVVAVVIGSFRRE